MNSYRDENIHKAVIGGIAVSLERFYDPTVRHGYTISFAPFDGNSGDDPEYQKNAIYLRNLVYTGVLRAVDTLRSNQNSEAPNFEIYFELKPGSDENIQTCLKAVMEQIDHFGEQIPDGEHLTDLRRHYNLAHTSFLEHSEARYASKAVEPYIKAALELLKDNQVYVNEVVQDEVRETMSGVFGNKTPLTDGPQIYIEAACSLLRDYTMAELTPDVEEQVTERITQAYQEGLGR